MHALIKQLVDNGIKPVLQKDSSGEYFWDLQSGMKSFIYLYLDETGGCQHKVKLRYDREEIAEDLGDMRWIGRQAMHGRDYASDAWHEFLGNVR